MKDIPLSELELSCEHFRYMAGFYRGYYDYHQVMNPHSEFVKECKARTIHYLNLVGECSAWISIRKMEQETLKNINNATA